MRHLKTGRKFGRTSAHRKALFRNMVTALIDKERIRTTLSKAKELRVKVEKTITLGKKGTLHARRHALKLVADKECLKKIFGPRADMFGSRAQIYGPGPKYLVPGPTCLGPGPKIYGPRVQICGPGPV